MHRTHCPDPGTIDRPPLVQKDQRYLGPFSGGLVFKYLGILQGIEGRYLRKMHVIADAQGKGHLVAPVVLCLEDRKGVAFGKNLSFVAARMGFSVGFHPAIGKGRNMGDVEVVVCCFDEAARMMI